MKQIESIYNKFFTEINALYVHVKNKCDVSGTAGKWGKNLFREKINYSSWLRWHFSSRNWEIFLINN